MEKTPEELKKLPPELLAWYALNRRILPWREEISPYRTWVSEIMLQQTRVAAVLPYFARFTEAYPTVAALAEADEEELLRLWQGLGYYSRARNLRKAAQIIVQQYGGVFPAAYEELMRLPGIGDYTAGAILSIAMGQDMPAVDGNVLRVVSRITGFDGDVLDSKNRSRLRAWVADCLPRGQSGVFNQALMDLGATVCTPGGVPVCETCPAGAFCRAHREGRETALPVRAGKKPKRVEMLTVFVLSREGKTALRQREKKGLLAGLWEFPHVEGICSEQQAAAVLRSWGLSPHVWEKKLTAAHEFTHIRWEMTGFVVQAEGDGPDDWVWCDSEELRRKAIPTAFGKFIDTAGEN